MLILCLLLFVLVIPSDAIPKLEKYIRKYKPITSVEGTRTIHRYPKNIIEITLTFGATDEMILAAETAINDYYSGELGAQGDETEKMGEVMERYFGGFWSVGIFDDPYGYSWTIIRRSPSFVMFDVNGKGVAFAMESGIGKR
ncbi:hypothetical protein ANCCAN_05137 [Ancylostoma caninum]|uniref:Uncharacterized protein n=1 Tax=Ancylostoma caninum TaxID=29170 RepID=A0A368GWW8_ANCCA|nr:hypothetical protein ANCCAN_05137 [Ancylostoma caninum]